MDNQNLILAGPGEKSAAGEGHGVWWMRELIPLSNLVLQIKIINESKKRWTRFSQSKYGTITQRAKRTRKKLRRHIAPHTGPSGPPHILLNAEGAITKWVKLGAPKEKISKRCEVRPGAYRPSGDPSGPNLGVGKSLAMSCVCGLVLVPIVDRTRMYHGYGGVSPYDHYGVIFSYTIIRRSRLWFPSRPTPYPFGV